MNVIICIDDKNGMAFNHRRQSQDRLILADLLEVTKGKAIHMPPYTAKIFDFSQSKNIKVVDSPHIDCSQGEYCFIEEFDPAAFEEKIETLIIYKWNKVYPADVHFTIDLSEGGRWKLTESEDFAGSSHEKITREIYTTTKRNL